MSEMESFDPTKPLGRLRGKGVQPPESRLRGKMREKGEKSLDWTEGWDDSSFEHFLSGEMKPPDLAEFLNNKQIFKRNRDPEKNGAIFNIKRIWQKDGDRWSVTITDPIKGDTETRSLRDFYDDLLRFDSNRRLTGLYQEVK